MTDLSALWLPILLSAVVVFIISSIVHMAPLWHRGDYPKMKQQDAVMDALRPCNLPPGDYFFPRADNMADMRTPAYKEKVAKGPVVLMTVMPNGMRPMGPMLAQWFVYCLVINVFAAYIAGRALPQGTAYLQVFRFIGAAAFIAHSVALWQLSIWYARGWGLTLKYTFDGLLYALCTAGVFGWLWPR